MLRFSYFWRAVLGWRLAGAGLPWLLTLGWWLVLGLPLRRGLRSALGGASSWQPAGPPTRPRRPKAPRPARRAPRSPYSAAA